MAPTRAILATAANRAGTPWCAAHVPGHHDSGHRDPSQRDPSQRDPSQRETALAVRCSLLAPPGTTALQPRGKMMMLSIPQDARIRVVGDVHGDASAFAYASATDRFVLQLGDLTDHGPDSAGTLRIMFRLIDQQRGLFLLGNHDLKLARTLAGQQMRPDPLVQATIEQLDDGLRERVLLETERAPAWLRHGDALFVHGGFHTDMLDQPSPEHGLDRPHGAVARALYGEPTGRTQPDGYPERSLRWVDRIPAGVTVYCGHDQRSSDGRPYVRRGVAGGRAIFLDTGAGKGGHLSWIDL